MTPRVLFKQSNLFSKGQSRSLDISSDSQLFKSQCTAWTGFQEDVMELAVVHVRKYGLRPTTPFLPASANPTQL